jgi:hypothetical protein
MLERLSTRAASEVVKEAAAKRIRFLWSTGTPRTKLQVSQPPESQPSLGQVKHSPKGRVHHYRDNQPHG